MEDGAGDGVGGTNQVELNGVGEVARVFGEVLQALAGVVVEAVFVEFEVDHSAGEVEYRVDVEQFGDGVLGFSALFLAATEEVLCAFQFAVEGVDGDGVVVAELVEVAREAVALGFQSADDTFESPNGVGVDGGLEFVVDAVAAGNLGVVVVAGDVGQEVESDAGIDGGDEVEDGVAVVVIGRPVPCGFRAEEFESAEDGGAFAEGVFDTSGEREGKLKVPAEIIHAIFVLCVGVFLCAEEHGHSEAEAGAPMEFGAFAYLVAVEEVGPVEGDISQQGHGVGVERLVFVVAVGIDGYAGEVDEGVASVARLAVDIEEGVAQRDGDIGDNPFSEFDMCVEVQLVVSCRGFDFVAEEGLQTSADIDIPVVEG